MRRLLAAFFASFALCAAPVSAQQTVVTYVGPDGSRVAVTPAAPLPVTIGAGSTGAVSTTGTAGTISNANASAITTGGVSQQVFAANATRKYLFCQNSISATETLFVEIAGAASTSGFSYELSPGAAMTFDSSFIPSGTVNVLATTTGHRFICKQGS